MSTEQLILYIVGGVVAVWAVVKGLVPIAGKWLITRDEKLVEARLKTEAYQQVRAANYDDRTYEFLSETFELLRETLDYLKQNGDSDKARREERDRQHIESIQAINRMANMLSQHTSIVQILAQEAAVSNDKMDDLEEVVKSQLQICSMANRAALKKHLEENTDDTR